MTEHSTNQSSTDLTERVVRCQIVFGVIATVIGVAGFVHAGDISFTASKGAALGWGSYELTLMSYNRFGALFTLILGLVGLAAGLSKRTKLGGVAAAGFVGIFLLGVIQVRADGESLFGSSPQTMAFSLAMALGFGVTAALTDLAADADSTTR